MKKAIGWVNQFGVYVFCFAGVICTKAIPDLRAGDSTFVLPSWETLAGSGFIALLVVAIQERMGDKVGKHKRFFRRASAAFLWGYFFQEIVEKALEFIK